MSCAPEVGAICCFATLVHAGGAPLARYPEQGQQLDLADVLREYLLDFPAHAHFDVARLLIDQAVRLGHASGERELHRQPAWKPINQAGSKVQAYVIDQY